MESIQGGGKARMTKAQVKKYIKQMEEKREIAKIELERELLKQELEKNELDELDKKIDDLF
ncbi:hypothetical protein H3C61_04205 [Candidatus Gracilibacteria bacterium]|nr:hypothetical protein [Candidatus Gracilibacteria bacterium]